MFDKNQVNIELQNNSAFNNIVCVAQKDNFLALGEQSGVINLFRSNKHFRQINLGLELNAKSELSISETGIFLMIKMLLPNSENCVEVWDILEMKCLKKFKNRLISIAEFATINSVDYLIISPEPYVISIFELPKVELKFDLNRKDKYPQYFFQSAFVKNQWIFGTGYFKDEPDTFYHFSLEKIIRGQETTIPGKRLEEVRMLSVGSDINERLLFYRNPDGSEDNADTEEELRSGNLLHGFTGFYSRSDDGGILRKIPYQALDIPRKELFSTETNIVVGLKNEIRIIPIDKPAQHHSIYTKVYFLDQLRKECIYLLDSLVYRIIIT